MPRAIYVLNGPNLNLLGVREPEVYGHQTLEDVRAICEARATSLGFTVVFRQTNSEAQLIDWVQEARTEACGLVLNPAGYGHTSVALLDALKALVIPIVECHLSNPSAREAFRHKSYVSMAATGIICGFGAGSYDLAVNAVCALVNPIAVSAA